MSSTKTEALRRRLRLPVIGAPLFIISTPALVIAQCTAGIVGSFPALNARPSSRLDEWIHEVQEALAAHDRAHPDRPAAPFAVNQIVHRSNDRLEHDLEVCVRRQVPLVITSLGARPEVNTAVHSYGGLVFHDIINDAFAHKAVEKGADGLIAVAAGAGGHAGRLSPFALIQEIRAWFDGPLALSGAIANGGAVLAAQAMGADFAYVGSAFIATREANAAEGHKRMVVDSRADDVVYTSLFTGIHGNYLRGSIVAAGLDPDRLPGADASTMNFGSSRETSSGATSSREVKGEPGEARAPSEEKGDATKQATKAWRDIWGGGQGVGAVDAVVPAADLVARLAREYDAARDRVTDRPAPVAASSPASAAA